MGLIRKAMSVSTLGAVDYRSRNDASKKVLLANARLANAQAERVEARTPDPVAGKWEPVVAAIESGEASWADLTRMQRLSMPLSYQLRCKAAERRRTRP